MSDTGRETMSTGNGELVVTVNDTAAWVRIGSIADNVSADFAREVMCTYEIPAVVISRSGFLGQAGLALPRFYKAGVCLFEVSVPADVVEEACGILDMVLGDTWRREEA
jgi:hypothetical protein